MGRWQKSTVLTIRFRISLGGGIILAIHGIFLNEQIR